MLHTKASFQVVVFDDDVVRTAVNLEKHTERDHIWSYEANAMRYQAYRQFVFSATHICATGPTGELFFYHALAYFYKH